MTIICENEHSTIWALNLSIWAVTKKRNKHFKSQNLSERMSFLAFSKRWWRLERCKRRDLGSDSKTTCNNIILERSTGPENEQNYIIRRFQCIFLSPEASQTKDKTQNAPQGNKRVALASHQCLGVVYPLWIIRNPAKISTKSDCKSWLNCKHLYSTSLNQNFKSHVHTKANKIQSTRHEENKVRKVINLNPKFCLSQLWKALQWTNDLNPASNSFPKQRHFGSKPMLLKCVKKPLYWTEANSTDKNKDKSWKYCSQGI